MFTYALTARDAQGRPLKAERVQLANDGESFPAAGRLLDAEAGADHVEVFHGERPVLSRRREAPAPGRNAGWPTPRRDAQGRPARGLSTCAVSRRPVARAAAASWSELSAVSMNSVRPSSPPSMQA